MTERDPIASSSQTQTSRPLITILLGAIVALAIAVSAWFLFHVPVAKEITPGSATIKLNMSSAELAYFANIQVKDLALSQAENFLHQEVTILNGSIVNSGPETISALDLTVQFSDDMQQVALRETRGVLGTPTVPLGPGQERAFEISFDHVPLTWNRQLPRLRVTNLSLMPRR